MNEPGIQAGWGSLEGTSDIMLQGFHWACKNNGYHGEWWDLVKSKAQNIKDAKISMVWLPPASKTPRQDLNEGGDGNTACGYTPMDYYDLGEYRQWVQDSWPNYSDAWYEHSVAGDNNPDVIQSGGSSIGTETLYGSKSELISCINALHSGSWRVNVIGDMVLPHRGPRQKGTDKNWVYQGGMWRPEPRWGDDMGQLASANNPPSGSVWDKVQALCWGKNDNNPPEIASEWGGRGINDGEVAGFGADVCHGDPNVKEQIKAWMYWMKHAIGFDGWRYDYVKGLAGRHIKDYNKHTQPYFSVGEWVEATNVQEIISWIDTTGEAGANGSHVGVDDSSKSAAFDFPMKSHLNAIFGGTDYPNPKSFDKLRDWVYSDCTLTGAWPVKAVTFLDNHDTYNQHAVLGNKLKGFPTDEKRLLQGHAFILTHPGTPCIFWPHFFDSGAYVQQKIAQLCRARVELGITSTTKVNVIRATGNLYVAEMNTRAAGVDYAVQVKIGDGAYSPGAGWTTEVDGDADGKGYRIWKKVR